MNRKTLQSLILALEAALIIVSLVTGSGTTVGMICYWSIAALNHLTDFIIRWIPCAIPARCWCMPSTTRRIRSSQASTGRIRSGVR